jgi:hypothetical protein
MHPIARALILLAGKEASKHIPYEEPREPVKWKRWEYEILMFKILGGAAAGIAAIIAIAIIAFVGGSFIINFLLSKILL